MSKQQKYKYWLLVDDEGVKINGISRAQMRLTFESLIEAIVEGDPPTVEWLKETVANIGKNSTPKLITEG